MKQERSEGLMVVMTTFVDLRMSKLLNIEHGASPCIGNTVCL